jgi:hypothetical protein
MINAAQDEVIPRQCTEKLAEALGIKDRVIWFEGLGITQRLQNYRAP